MAMLNNQRVCFFCFGASLGHKAGEAICTTQPPLSLLQYSDSRSLCLLAKWVVFVELGFRKH